MSIDVETGTIMQALDLSGKTLDLADLSIEPNSAPQSAVNASFGFLNNMEHTV